MQGMDALSIMNVIIEKIRLIEAKMKILAKSIWKTHNQILFIQALA